MRLRLVIACFVIFHIALGLQAQQQVRSFIFGHSLIDHRPPIHPTPSDETTVPHWLFLMSEEAGHEYAATGKYGFLPQHAMLPPFAQWGYDLVPEVWDSDRQEFHEVDFNNVLLTAGNFMQWQPSDFLYPGDTLSPLSATRRIVNWVQNQEDSIAIYIYENWPDMAPFLKNNFPPSSSEMQDYHGYTEGEFHDWWIEYHDFVLSTHPRVKMIPVGPILAHLIQMPELENITPEDWYEDDAPHGKPNIYLLASVITYMATYQEKAPLGLRLPDLIHPDILDHWNLIIDEIWDELWTYSLPNGESRVFFRKRTTSVPRTEDFTFIGPNPFAEGLKILLQSDETFRMIIFNEKGQKVVEHWVDGEIQMETADWSPGVYLAYFVDMDGTLRSAQNLIKL